MKALFLKAKHWQLFLVMYGIPMILQMVLVMYSMSKIMSYNDPSSMMEMFTILPFIMVLSGGVLFLWLWSLGTGLNDMLPSKLKLNTIKLKAALLFTAFYFIFFVIIWVKMFNSMTSVSPNVSTISSAFAIILPLHLLAMFCMFYTQYFIAKALKTNELKRNTSFKEFIGEFLLLWIYFVGVWILQPRVNALYDSYIHGDSSDIIDNELI